MPAISSRKKAGASSTNTVSQDQEDQLEGDVTPDIIAFTTSSAYLGLELSLPQRTLLKASYGIKLEPDELEVFQVCTGRTLDPQINFSTVVAICGARAGKDSRFVGPTALYESEFGGHTLSKGETATIALYAQDRDAAGVTFQYISDYVTESPKLASAWSACRSGGRSSSRAASRSAPSRRPARPAARTAFPWFA